MLNLSLEMIRIFHLGHRTGGLALRDFRSLFVGVELIFKTCWLNVTPTLWSALDPNSNFTLSSLFIVIKFKEIMPSLFTIFVPVRQPRP